MSECKHDFIGSAEAVRCRICGLTLSAAEYIRYLHPEAPTEHVKPPTKRSTRKKVNTDE